MWHLAHTPIPKLNHRHHIIPLSWEGPDTDSNETTICPTGHANAHKLLDYLLSCHKRGVDPEWFVTRTYGPAERELCRLAMESLS